MDFFGEIQNISNEWRRRRITDRKWKRRWSIWKLDDTGTALLDELDSDRTHTQQSITRYLESEIVSVVPDFQVRISLVISWFFVNKLCYEWSTLNTYYQANSNISNLKNDNLNTPNSISEPSIQRNKDLVEVVVETGWCNSRGLFFLLLMDYWHTATISLYISYILQVIINDVHSYNLKRQLQIQNI